MCARVCDCERVYAASYTHTHTHCAMAWHQRGALSVYAGQIVSVGVSKPFILCVRPGVGIMLQPMDFNSAFSSYTRHTYTYYIDGVSPSEVCTYSRILYMICTYIMYIICDMRTCACGVLEKYSLYLMVAHSGPAVCVCVCFV